MKKKNIFYTFKLQVMIHLSTFWCNGLLITPLKLYKKIKYNLMCVFHHCRCLSCGRLYTNINWDSFNFLHYWNMLLQLEFMIYIKTYAPYKIRIKLVARFLKVRWELCTYAITLMTKYDIFPRMNIFDDHFSFYPNSRKWRLS